MRPVTGRKGLKAYKCAVKENNLYQIAEVWYAAKELSYNLGGAISPCEFLFWKTIHLMQSTFNVY